MAHPRTPHRTRYGRPRLAALLASASTLLALLLPVNVTAQGGISYSGIYTLMTEEGQIELQLQQEGASVTGYLILVGQPYKVEGQLDDNGIYGTIWTGQVELYFEAEMQSNYLYMIIAQIDPNTGAPDPASAGEYYFQNSDPQPRPVPPVTQPQPPTAAPPPASTPPTTWPPTRSPSGQTTGGQTTGGQPTGTSTPPTGMQTAEVGRRYEAGSVVGSVDAGVAFVVPPAYYAGYSPQENAFMVISDTQSGLLIVEALSNIDLDSAVAQLGQSFQTSSEVTVVPQGQAQITGNVARASFAVYMPNGALPLYVMGVAGQAGNVFIVAGLGGPSEQAVVQELVERVAASATLFTPTRASATTMAGQLAGAHLSRSHSSSGTGIMDSSSIQLDLCSDGAYAYTASSNVGVSVSSQDGASMSGLSSSSDEEQGRWVMESGLLGPVLVLHANTGGIETYLGLLEAGGTLYVDGLPVMLARSSRCF